MNTIIIKQYNSGAHISVEGCTKIRDEIVTFFDSDKVISVELKTPRKTWCIACVRLILTWS
jgi:oligoribonuclease NrnB/cAMP/cGMP phosphodiesterase (DHH superfamily)